jgi:dTDP-glucose 4,6-dehydratase
MRVLVAGGAGFLGYHLVQRLLRGGHRVIIVDNFLTGRRINVDRLKRSPGGADLELLYADVVHLPRLPGPIDAVLNLASPASPRDYLRWPIATLETGSSGTRALLECARAHQARFLLASTSEVYGDPQVHPQPECYWGHVNPVGPRAVYDEAKRYAEALATAFAAHEGVAVRIARIFNTYGPAMRLDDGRVIPSFVTQALRGEPLTVQGHGRHTRSYCYVDDLVAGLETLLWSDVEGPVNLGNTEEHTVLETAQRIIALTGSRSRIEFHPLPVDDPQLRCPDLTRARERLAWQPRVGFEDGLALTVADIEGRLRDGEQLGATTTTHGERRAARTTVLRLPAERVRRGTGGNSAAMGNAGATGV